MNDKKVTILNELWMTKGHNIVNDIINNIINDIVNNKKEHNIVKHSFAHKPDGLLV